MIRQLLMIWALLSLAAPAAAADLKPDLIIKGALTGADHQTYRPIYFQVPAGVTRLTVAFDYDHANRSAEGGTQARQRRARQSARRLPRRLHHHLGVKAVHDRLAGVVTEEGLQGDGGVGHVAHGPRKARSAV